MDACEIYYRRSYNAINRLIEVYRYGYDKKNTLKYRSELLSKYRNNPKVMQSEFNNIMFTTMIALLGLNKEAIEQTGKIIEYKKTVNEIKLDETELTEEQKERLKEFNSRKAISTDFDSWLNIKVNPSTDNENVDYLKRVRNSLLHSNFSIDETIPSMPFVKLKTKSYYEAELFNLKFQLFVFEYFGNINNLGLSEVIYTFQVPQNKITNLEDLVEYLILTNINKITYKNLKTLGENSPELLLKKCSDAESKVNVEKFLKKMKNIKNADDIKCETERINSKEILYIINYIMKKYGEEFYNFDETTQSGIISAYLKYNLNPKSEISNWMVHFWYLYSTINNNKFNTSFFDGDNFGNDSCYSALMVLKSYLLIYRLQNNDFDEIEYGKIDFNKDEDDIKLYSENQDETLEVEDYFEKTFEKEKNKNELTDENEIWNKIICDVVRNSLAHGNIRTYLFPVTLTPMIELKDIDQKKGTTRAIIMPLSKYERFLKSEAFTPGNCYKKEDHLLVKK